MSNLVKEKLQNGKQVLGTFCSMGNPSCMECLGYSGLDYAIIDTEHGPFDTESAMDLVRAAENVGLTPFMRIADVTHKEIQRAVDMGVQGLIIPCLRTLEEVKAVVNFAKYPPVGNRGFIKGRGSGFGCKDWSSGSVAEFCANSNEQVLVIPQCETVEMLEKIEEAVNINGVDGIFIGPFDLSISMGIPGDFDNPKFLAALDRIHSACRNANKYCFIFSSTNALAKKFLAEGYDSVTHSIDFTILIDAYRAVVADIKG